MGKHEAAAPKKRGRKRRTPLLLLLAVLIVGACFATWYLTKPPEQTQQIGGNESKNPEDPVEEQNDPEDESIRKEDYATPEVSVDGDRELKKGWYTILLAGTNDDYNTDTIMLCSVDSENNKVHLTSINRDTMVDSGIKKNLKINCCYGVGGIEKTCEEVTEITGIPINYYVLIRMDAFRELVDLIGGVEYDVPFDMIHRDKDLESDIYLMAGKQLLDGRKALQFVRYRSTSENDFGRVNRQKDFLIATLKQVKSNFSLSQIKKYITIFNENVDTNMKVQEMLWFYLNVADEMNFSADMTSGTLPCASTGMYTAPGMQYAAAYVYLDAQEVVDYVNETINPFTTDLTTGDVHIIHRED